MHSAQKYLWSFNTYSKNMSSLVPAPILKAKGQHLSSTIMKRYKEYCGGVQDDLKFQNQYEQVRHVQKP